MRTIRDKIGAGVLALAVGLAAPLSAQEALVPRDQLIRLETHLEKIRKEYELSRVMSGGALVATGSLIGVGGTLVAQSSSFTIYDGSATDAQNYQNQMRNTITAASWLYGGVFIVPGVLTLVLKPDYETLPEAFRDTPATSDRELRDKVTRGEVILQGLSDKARNDRWLAAGLLGLSGASMVFLAVEQSAAYRSYDFSGRPVPVYEQTNFLSGALVLGAALIRTLVPTTPENENRAYQGWKEGLQADLR